MRENVTNFDLPASQWSVCHGFQVQGCRGPPVLQGELALQGCCIQEGGQDKQGLIQNPLSIHKLDNTHRKRVERKRFITYFLFQTKPASSPAQQSELQKLSHKRIFEYEFKKKIMSNKTWQQIKSESLHYLCTGKYISSWQISHFVFRCFVFFVCGTV